MKECLECKKEFESKRDAGKFCSVNCRVKWNRKNRDNSKKKDAVTQYQMQVLYNSIKALIEDAKNGNVGFLPEHPSTSIPMEYKKGTDLSYVRAATPIEPLSFAKMEERATMNSYDLYKSKFDECRELSDFEAVGREIKADRTIGWKMQKALEEYGKEKSKDIF